VPRALFTWKMVLSFESELVYKKEMHLLSLKCGFQTTSKLVGNTFQLSLAILFQMSSN